MNAMAERFGQAEVVDRFMQFAGPVQGMDRVHPLYGAVLGPTSYGSRFSSVAKHSCDPI